jgi:glyoxylase-like metal-dependent hydrolase (beta-lactamase superfamily II)/rhodanese-related sulfurtransferase
MEFPPPPEPVESIEAETLRQRIDAGETVTLLDTRPAEKYDRWHIEGESVTAFNIPFTTFQGDDIDEETLDGVPTDRTITAVCAIGRSSEYVAGVLAEEGYEVEHLADGMEGWARVYDAVEVSRYGGPGRVWQYQRPSSGCLGYLVVDGGEAAVVDPLRAFTGRYLADADERGAELTYAVDTHVHADHVSGLRRLAERGVEGVIPAPAADRGLVDADELTLLQDGDTLQVGAVPMEAVHAPGHTSGMTALEVGPDLLLTGDELFIESVGRPDLEATDEGAPAAARQLHASLQTLLGRPDATLVCPGHHGESTGRAADGTYTARLGDLRGLEVLSLSRERFVETVLEDMPPRPPNDGAIVATNLGRQNPDDEAAFTLELGPNNCAATRQNGD